MLRWFIRGFFIYRTFADSYNFTASYFNKRHQWSQRFIHAKSREPKSACRHVEYEESCRQHIMRPKNWIKFKKFCPRFWGRVHSCYMIQPLGNFRRVLNTWGWAGTWKSMTSSGEQLSCLGWGNMFWESTLLSVEREAVEGERDTARLSVARPSVQVIMAIFLVILCAAREGVILSDTFISAVFYLPPPPPILSLTFTHIYIG